METIGSGTFGTGTYDTERTTPRIGGSDDRDTEQLKDKATQLTSKARSKAAQELDARKGEICSLLEKMASAVEDERLGSYAADYVRRGAQYLRAHDANELLSSASSRARSNPAAVLGASFVAGLAFARLLRR
jgi:hypothetical protein